MPYRRKDSPYWWISYSAPSGKKTCESSGTTSYTEAKALEDEKRVAARRAKAWGTDPEKTFDEVVLAYVEAHQHIASAERNRYTLRHLLPMFTGQTVNQITGPMIREYIQSRNAEGASNDTIRRELGLFSAACQWCARALDWSIKNPAQGRLPPASPGRVRWISRAEAAALLHAAQAQKRAPHLVDFIRLALHTGMRRGELLGLEWARVDLHQCLIYLEPEHQKNRQRGSVPLNREARAALLNRARYRAEHCPAGRWVFCHPDGSRIQSVKHSFTSACKAAGIENFRVHDLRHTCAAWLVQAGVPVAQVGELLRHRDIRMTMRYAHLAPENTRAAVELLESGGSYDFTTETKKRAD